MAGPEFRGFTVEPVDVIFHYLRLVWVDTPYHVHAGLPGVPHHAEHL